MISFNVEQFLRIDELKSLSAIENLICNYWRNIAFPISMSLTTITTNHAFITMGVGKGKGGGGHRGAMALLDFHTLSPKTPKFQKFFHF